MTILKRTLVAVLAFLGLFLAGNNMISAQAASKTVKLPSSLKGTWYGYAGSGEFHKQRYYQVDKVVLTANTMAIGIYYTSQKSLKSLSWQQSILLPVTYVKKAKGVYKLQPRTADVGSFILSRKVVRVKVLGQNRTALKLRGQGSVHYVFRQALRSHNWHETTLKP